MMDSDSSRQTKNFISCIVAFFSCSLVVSLLSASIEYYLIKIDNVHGNDYFFVISAVPTIIDIFAITIYSYLKISYRKLMLISCTVGLIGVSIMYIKNIYCIILGRSIIGILYAQYPFLCLTIATMENKEKKQALFYAISLMAYFIGPLFLYFTIDMTNILFFCGLACVMSFCITYLYAYPIEPIIEREMDEDDPENKLMMIYYITIQIVSNLYAASVFYIVSPIMTNLAMTESNIGLVIGGIMGIQIITSMMVYFFPRTKPLKLNLGLIIYCLASLVLFGYFVQYEDLNKINQNYPLNKKIILICLILNLAVPISGFAWTSVQIAIEFNNKNKMMSINGIVNSLMYIIGPLLNSLFLIKPAYPFAIQALLFIMCFVLHQYYIKNVVHFR